MNRIIFTIVIILFSTMGFSQSQIPSFKDIHPNEKSRNFKESLGFEIIENLKTRFYSANAIGSGFYGDCEYSIESDEEKTTFKVSEVQNGIIFEEDTLTIYNDKRYEISVTETDDVDSFNVNTQQYTKSDIKAVIERIRDSKSKVSLYLAYTSPQYPYNHYFQSQNISCHFSAALY